MVENMIDIIMNTKIKERIQVVKINGKSMFPTFYTGDKCFLKKKDKYYLGDILVFENYNHELVAHRLVYITKFNNYVCKGDNAYLIEKIDYENIIGYITDVERNNIKINFKSNDFVLAYLSFAVHNEFCKNKYNLFLTQKSIIHDIYTKILTGRAVLKCVNNLEIKNLNDEEKNIIKYVLEENSSEFSDYLIEELLKQLYLQHLNREILINCIINLFFKGVLLFE